MCPFPNLLWSSGAGNDYQKDLQFKKLNEQKDTIEVKVLRDGVNTVIINTELVVGDVLVLDTGDKVRGSANWWPQKSLHCRTFFGTAHFACGSSWARQLLL